jgi:hypothetical protein
MRLAKLIVSLVRLCDVEFTINRNANGAITGKAGSHQAG